MILKTRWYSRLTCSHPACNKVIGVSRQCGDSPHAREKDDKRTSAELMELASIMGWKDGRCDAHARKARARAAA